MDHQVKCFEGVARQTSATQDVAKFDANDPYLVCGLHFLPHFLVLARFGSWPSRGIARAERNNFEADANGLSLHSQSNIEAENSVDRLCDLVRKLLEGNDMLSRRLAAYEIDSTVHEPRKFTTEAPDTEEIQRTVQGFAFEELLMNSRAYRKAANDGDDQFSITSSAG